MIRSLETLLALKKAYNFAKKAYKKRRLIIGILLGLFILTLFFISTLFKTFIIQPVSVFANEQEAKFNVSDEKEIKNIPFELIPIYKDAGYEYQSVPWAALMATHYVMTNFSEKKKLFHTDALNLPNSIWDGFQVSKREIDWQREFHTEEEIEEHIPFSPDRKLIDDLIFTLANYYSQQNFDSEKEIEKAINNITRNKKDKTEQIKAMTWFFNSKYGGFQTGIALWPVEPQFDESYITSPFGSRTDPITGAQYAFHNAVDIACTQGSKIFSIKDGAVTYAGRATSYGTLIKIDHGQGMETYYAHSEALHVSTGDEVTAGQHIADCGSEGDSTGYHLHIEVRINGKPVDPMLYLVPPGGGTYAGQYDAFLAEASAKFNVPVALIMGIIQQESAWNPLAEGPLTKYGTRAQGLMQLMSFNFPSVGITDPFDPYQSIMGGTNYFSRTCYSTYPNDLPRALACYNAGPGAVEKALGYDGSNGYKETINYVRKVTGYYYEFQNRGY